MPAPPFLLRSVAALRRILRSRFVKMADYTKGWSLPAGKKQSSGKASGGVLGRFGGGGGGSGAKASKSKGGSTKYRHQTFLLILPLIKAHNIILPEQVLRHSEPRDRPILPMHLLLPG